MNKFVPCITINTDASYSKEHNEGGYAFYIVCNGLKIQKAAMFKVKPTSALRAEMMAIANAIACLLQQKELPQTAWIVVNSDCKYAFGHITRKSKNHLGKMIAEDRAKLRKRTAFKGKLPQFEFRYVKAHNGTPDARSWVNDWCDKEARTKMREAVKLKLEIQNEVK